MSVLDENNRLKQDESKLLSNLEMLKQKYDELEQRCNKMQEHAQGLTKERVAKKFREFKLALNKVTKTLNEDVSIHYIYMPVVYQCLVTTFCTNHL